MADSRFWLFSCVILTTMSNLSSQEAERYPAGCRSCQVLANTFTNCSKECRMPVALNDRDTEQISLLMEAQHLKTAWFGLRRIRLDEFLWLDNRHPGGSFTGRSWSPESNCAYVNVRDIQIDAGLCSFRSKGVICQVNPCRGCTHHSFDRSNCVMINNTCYIKQPYKFKWEEAKAFCTKNGWEMAVLSGNEDEMTNQLKIAFKQGTRHHYENFYWVGLRREEWRFDLAAQASEKIAISRWADNEPKPGQNCSVLVKETKEEPLWKSVSCSAKFNALCMPNRHKSTLSVKLATVKPTKTRPTTTHNTPPVQGEGDIGLTQQEVDDKYNLHAWSISSITLLGFLLVVVVTFIPVYYFTRVNGSDIKGITEEVMKKFLNLLSKDFGNNNEGGMKLHKREDTVTEQNERGTEEQTECQGSSHSQDGASVTVSLVPAEQTAALSRSQEQTTPLIEKK